MGKPEIIGYRADPDNWSAPRLPEMTFDPDGMWVDGPAGVRELIEDEDAFYRYHGYKRAYKPREFRAEWRHGGYRVHCKTCGTSSLYAGYLPLDAVRDHAESDRHYSASWDTTW